MRGEVNLILAFCGSHLFCKGLDDILISREYCFVLQVDTSRGNNRSNLDPLLRGCPQLLTILLVFHLLLLILGLLLLLLLLGLILLLLGLIFLFLHALFLLLLLRVPPPLCYPLSPPTTYTLPLLRVLLLLLHPRVNLRLLRFLLLPLLLCVLLLFLRFLLLLLLPPLLPLFLPGHFLDKFKSCNDILNTVYNTNLQPGKNVI